jgi:hypothetical protein
MNYQNFKEKFITALKEIEKDKKNEDLYEFLNFDEDYLYNLYINVYKNNPDYEFIFQNPLLILNYIFIEINKATDKEVKKSYIDHGLNISKINEEKNSFQSSFSQKNEEKEKTEKTEKDTDKIKPILSKSSSSNSNDSKSISEENSASNTSSSNKSSENKGNSKTHNSKDNDLIRMNTLTTKFLLSQLVYDYNSNEILETQEISLSFICEKKLEESTIMAGKQKELKDFDFFKGYGLSNRDKDFHKTFINDPNKLLYSSRDNSKDEDLRKTYANYKKYYSKNINPHSKENLSGYFFSPNGKSKSKSKSKPKKKQSKRNINTFEEENKAEDDDNFFSLKKKK